ncbi:MAG: hypothetical protein KDK91_31445, partial [Gammaproteobacteria bacterium]|nr:hypothetical protein [Gammaproteobacteria bacterium]
MIRPDEHKQQRWRQRAGRPVVKVRAWLALCLSLLAGSCHGLVLELRLGDWPIAGMVLRDVRVEAEQRASGHWSLLARAGALDHPLLGSVLDGIEVDCPDLQVAGDTWTCERAAVRAMAGPRALVDGALEQIRIAADGYAFSARAVQVAGGSLDLRFGNERRSERLDLQLNGVDLQRLTPLLSESSGRLGLSSLAGRLSGRLVMTRSGSPGAAGGQGGPAPAPLPLRALSLDVELRPFDFASKEGQRVGQ